MISQRLSKTVFLTHNPTALMQFSAANTGIPEENSELANEIVAPQFTTDLCVKMGTRQSYVSGNRQTSVLNMLKLLVDLWVRTGEVISQTTLAEGTDPRPIAGLFLVAVPCWGKRDWELEYTLPEDFASHLPPISQIFMYHSRHDEVVPFSHLRRYQEQLPQATVRELDGRNLVK